MAAASETLATSRDTPGGRRWQPWLAPAIVLVTLVPLIWPAIPPLEDLPGHIGRYRVMLGSDAATLSQFFAFHWHVVGNLGVDAIVYALAPLIGLEPAVKVAVMLIVALTASGIVWISYEAHGRVTAGSLFALALTYNFPLQFGFVNYVLSMALALNGLALWLRLGRQQRLRLRAALFGPIAVLTWFAHAMGWGVLGLMAFAAEAARRRSLGRGWWAALWQAGLACIPLALPLLLLIWWRSGDQAGVTTGFFMIAAKLSWLGDIFRDRWQWLDVASAVIVGVFLYHAARGARGGWSRPVAAAALLLFAAFVVMPYGLFGSAFADMRLAPYAVMLALLATRSGEAGDARERHWLVLAGTAFFLVRVAATTASWWLYDRDYDRELAAVAHIERGARVAAFVGTGGCTRPWALHRTNHLPALAIARRAAFANDQWRMEGAPLLTVSPALAQDYAYDPSQTVLPNRCRPSGRIKRVDDALAELPRGAFDYVWLIQPPPYDPALLGGMHPVWRSGSSMLLRIDRPQTPRTH